VDFKRALSFMTQDPQWIAKVGIGTLVSLVPILNFAAMGYRLDVIRNVYFGREFPLPEWDNFGDKFVRGLLLAVVQFLWSLPLLVLLCPLYIVAFATGLATPEGQDPGAGVGFAFACIGLLAALGSVLLVPFVMTAEARYAVTNNFSEALPGPVWRELRGNFRPWLQVILFAVAFGLGVGLVAACTFGLGALLVIPLIFYMQLVTAHWYAQAHRASVGASTAPSSMV
jgi:hypothetical protein